MKKKIPAGFPQPSAFTPDQQAFIYQTTEQLNGRLETITDLTQGDWERLFGPARGNELWMLWEAEKANGASLYGFTSVLRQGQVTDAERDSLRKYFHAIENRPTHE
jgi:hypothetical protein